MQAKSIKNLQVYTFNSSVPNIVHLAFCDKQRLPTITKQRLWQAFRDGPELSHVTSTSNSTINLALMTSHKYGCHPHRFLFKLSVDAPCTVGSSEGAYLSASSFMPACEICGVAQRNTLAEGSSPGSLDFVAHSGEPLHMRPVTPSVDRRQLAAALKRDRQRVTAYFEYCRAQEAMLKNKIQLGTGDPAIRAQAHCLRLELSHRVSKTASVKTLLA